MHLKFYDRFNETDQYKISGKSDQWILSCSTRPNGQTDTLNEANGRFSQLYEQANQRIEFPSVNIATAKHRENANNIIAWAK
jgi:hypothetical protein